MYQPGKILFVGGGDPPTTEALVIDLTTPTPTWRTVAPMATARRQLNATLLPDGRVLVTGGTSGPGFNNTTTPVFTAEIWDPVTEQWSTLASASVARLYHSTAALLPDGTVLSAGTDGVTQAEVFSPPYLFKGSRPTISVAPGRLGYGQPFALETADADAVTRLTLLALGSVTHGFSQSQRLLDLSFTHRVGGLDVVAPASGAVAPPGPYLLFALNGNGVPSVGAIVQVGPVEGQLTLTSMTPDRVVAGAPDFTLSVRGGGFTNASVVRWNGVDRPTTFVAPTQLDAVIPAADVATVGTVSLTVADPAITAASNALTFDVDSTVTLTVARAGTGDGTVTSTPAGIQCPDDCTEPLGITPLTLTATPSPGSSFTGWSGGGCTGTAPCTVVGNVATMVTAAFTGGPPAFAAAGTTVTPNPVTGGATTVIQTSVSDIGGVVSNALVDLEIYSSGGSKVYQQAISGQSFGPGEARTLQWTWPVPGSLAAGTYTIKLGFFSSNWGTLYTWLNNAGPVTVQASAVPTLSVNRSGGGAGAVTSTPAGISCGTDCTEPYPSGTAVTLTATPAAGATFTGWSGDCTGTGPCTVTMTTNRAATASFASTGLSYSLTVTQNGTGGGTVVSVPSGINCGTSCSAAYGAGTVVTLTATPAGGSVLSGWLGACAASSGPCSVTLDANRAVTVTFTRQTTGAPRFTADLVTVSPNPVARGTSTVVAATVTNTGGAAAGIIVDLEIYASSGARVSQQVTSGQTFQSGERRTLQWTWPVPATLATGPYTIKLGFFSSNWATLYTWLNSAGSLTVK
jgi:hypothetical protein